MRAKAEAGPCVCKTGNMDNHLQPLEAERGQAEIPLPLGRNQPCQRLDLGLPGPELGENRFLLFKPPVLPPFTVAAGAD